MENMKLELENLILHERSRTHAGFIAEIIIEKPELVSVILEIVFANKNPLSKWASWPLQIASKKNTNIFNDYIPTIIDHLPDIKFVTTQRCLLSVLTTAPIPKEKEAFILDYTTDILTNKSSSIASIIYSIDIYYNIAKENLNCLMNWQ